MNKMVIFDLDGTLADISARRQLSTKSDGKLDWDKFFDPKNISLDKPNHAVIHMAQVLAENDHTIVILSGRSKGTELTTKSWLNKHHVPWHIIKMRPTDSKWNFMPDDKLKKIWLDEFDKNGIVAVFDDRDKVVNMWRKNGLTCFQVAEGKF